MTPQDVFNQYIGLVQTCGEVASLEVANQLAAWSVNQARANPALAGVMVLWVDDLMVHPSPAVQLIGVSLAEALAPLAAPAIPTLEAVFNNPSSPEIQAQALIALIANNHPQSVAFVLTAWSSPLDALKMAALQAVAVYQLRNGNASTVFGQFIADVITTGECRYQLMATAQQMEFVAGI